MKDYLKEAKNIHLSYYLEAADILDINYEIIVKGLIARFEYKNKHWFIVRTVTPLINSPGKKIAGNKNLANTILNKSGIPTPKYKLIKSPKEALAFFKEEKDIVIKPTVGLGGKGVSVLPTSPEEVLSSFNFAFKNNKNSKKVMVEKYIHGENYRFLTLLEEVVGIVKRLKPHIKGDGKLSIKELINKTNSTIPIDSETEKVLKSQNFNLESIPKKGEYIIARNNTNSTTGGKTQEYSKQAHPYYKKLAMKSIKALGIKLGGVDIIAKDITKPGDCVINEINYNPGLRIHYQVDKGEKVKVAIPIMKYIRDNEL